MPLPPYIHRPKDAPDTAEDKARYQTVYCATAGSAAAPTAGLHFTPEILAAHAGNRVFEVETLTLHVGLGTFQPVRVEELADIRLHAEHYTLPARPPQRLMSRLLRSGGLLRRGLLLPGRWTLAQVAGVDAD